MSAVTVGRRAAVRSLVLPALATLVAFGLLIALGTWQVHRLTWKLGLVEQIQSRTTAPPTPLPPQSEWSALKPDDYAYRHVRLTGTFDHAQEAHVFRPLAPEDAHGRFSGIGDLVLTPLHLQTGGTVIVNRGFVPLDRLDPATRSEGQVAGVVTITGLMREPETRNWFTPADNPRAGSYFTRDPQAIASHFGLPDAAPFTVDADASAIPGGMPQAGETVLSIPNNHLSYALTWYGLALALVGVFGTFAWRRVFGPPPLVPQPSPSDRASQRPGASA